MLGHGDQRLRRILREGVDLNGDVVFEFRDRVARRRLGEHPVLALDLVEVLARSAGGARLGLGVRARRTPATVSTRSVAPAWRASAWAPRSASRPSSVST